MRRLDGLAASDRRGVASSLRGVQRRGSGAEVGRRARAIERQRRQVARLRPRADGDRPAADRFGRLSARRRVVGGSVPRDGDRAGRARAVHDRPRLGARVGARADRRRRTIVRFTSSRSAGRRRRPTADSNAEVVALESFSLGRVRAQRSLQGRIVLLPDGDPPGDPDTAARTRASRRRAARCRARSPSSSPDSDPDNQLTARGFGFGTAIGVLPAAQIGRDDAQTIRERLGARPGAASRSS